MKLVRAVLRAGVFICLCTSAWGGIRFSEPDINNKDDVLVTVRHTVAGTAPYTTLFSINVSEPSPEQSADVLTYYPEQMEMLAGRRILQLRNRYGRMRYDMATRTCSWMERTAGMPTGSSRAGTYVPSPDGAWFCFIRKTGPATGSVILEHTATGRTAIVAQNVACHADVVPVRWARDSSVLFYENNGNVYFLSPEPFIRGTETDEQHRRIGAGGIASVNVIEKYIIYIDGDCVYRINIRELYTLGLYAGIVGTGTAVGRLQDAFVPSVDYASVNAQATMLVVVHGRKTVAVYALVAGGSDFLSVVCYRPYVNAYGSVISAQVVWGRDGIPSVWFKLMPYTGATPCAAVVRVSGSRLVPVITVDRAFEPVLSPDGTRVLIASGTALQVYDTASWERVAELSGEHIVRAVWSSSDEVYVGGEHTIRRWTISAQTTSVILLSAAEVARWDDRTVIARTAGTWFQYDGVHRTWAETENDAERAAVVQNGRYRVYCGNALHGGYDNTLFYRTLSRAPATHVVFTASMEYNAAPPKAALVFDAYDGAAGVPQILSVLSEYAVPGTFFFNGEFIRRYPRETAQIAGSGHPCASLFFTAADLTAGTYAVDEEFIRRGLARNEDLFYQTTGKELSLIWHAPYYHTTRAMLDAGRNAGYRFVEPVLYSLDVVTLEQAASGMRYMASVDIIDALVAAVKEQGSGVIPVTVGILRGVRSDYLYESLDLLIAALLDEGVELIPAELLAR
ncbi:MAG: polysaccharide deacetylase family protein [Treponema sp.]|nr:polysaccharide deacetylase family protein [Treponema sp.]